MARWFPERVSKAIADGLGLEVKDAATRRASAGRGFVYKNQPYVAPGSDVDRMVRDGYEKVVVVFKAIDAIADKMSGWPIRVMEGASEDDWKPVEDGCLDVLNQYSNVIERSAKYLRYRLVSQLLLSKPGVFVEVIPSRGGGAIGALNLLPPGLTRPIPDADTFLSGFRVELPGEDRRRHIDLPVYDPEKRAGVIWIRKPHPTDPYSSITPLESAGISIDLDFYARLYNRNFLLNDGRAGQLVAVKGGLSPEDAAELKARFQPGIGGAGRTTVIEADSIAVQDTAVTPRDAQYAELRNIGKDDLLLALGTPESVIGNASGRTFDNADAEKENWLDVTVLPLSQVVEAGFDPLTDGGWGDDRRVKHDVSGEPVLRRRHELRVEKARADVAAGLITVDEWREIAEREVLDRPGTRVLWLPSGGKVAVGKADDEAEAGKLKPLGGPPDPGLLPGGELPPDGGGLGGFDAQIDELLASPQAPAGALNGGGAAPLALEAASLTGLLELEAKKFNPAQPRYPQGHPQGGQFMDLGDTALWLAGKPLKDGTPAGSVVDPNPGSTASPAGAAGGAGGARRFTTHPDAKVRAAANLITHPGNYPYPRVLGAPPAQTLGRTSQVKLVSLRKGDVVSWQGQEVAVAEVKRGRGGQVSLSLVADDGTVFTQSGSGQSTLYAVARTPHPTAVAQAKRDVAAAARAMGGSPAAAPSAATSTPSSGAATTTAAPASPPPGAVPVPPTFVAALASGPVAGPFTQVMEGEYIGSNRTMRVYPDGSALVWNQPLRVRGVLPPATRTRMSAQDVRDELTDPAKGARWKLAAAGSTSGTGAATAAQAPTPAPSTPAAAATPAAALAPGTAGPFATSQLVPGMVFTSTRSVNRGATILINPNGTGAYTDPSGNTRVLSPVDVAKQLTNSVGIGSMWQVLHTQAPGAAPAAAAPPRATAGPGHGAPSQTLAPGTVGPFTFTGSPVAGTYERQTQSGSSQAFVVHSSGGASLYDPATGGLLATFTPTQTSRLLADPVTGGEYTYRTSMMRSTLPQAAPTTPAPAAAAAPTTPPAPAAAAASFNLPPVPAGWDVYWHPQAGKHIYVDPQTGAMQVWTAQGKRSSSSATAAKLAAGHGKWQKIPAPMTGRVGGLAAPAPTTPGRARKVAAAARAQQPRTFPPAAAPTPASAPAGAPAQPGHPQAAPATPPASTPAPPAPSASRASAVVAAGVPKVGIDKSWKPVAGSQAGSNAASRMRDPSGTEHYVKSLGEQQADNEVAAGRLYRAAGVEVPDIAKADFAGTGYFAGHQSRHGISSQIVAGKSDMSSRMRSDAKYRDAVLEDFAVHAWLGNWDAVENNNTITSAKSGRPLTIDVGGSMAFRARGSRRPFTNTTGGFGTTVQELDSMRGSTAGHSARATFAQLKPDATDARFVAGVERVAAISPQDISRIVNETYPSLPAPEKVELARVLIARRADLAARAGVTLPENRRTAAAAAPAAAPAAAAVTPAGVPAGTYQLSGGTMTVRADGSGTYTDQNGRSTTLGSPQIVSNMLQNGGVQTTLTNTSAPTPAPAAPAAPAAPSPAAGTATPPPDVAAAMAKLGTKTPAQVLTHPPNYPYPVVAGAPIAHAGVAPKPIKVQSLRKGDVVSHLASPVTVVSVNRGANSVTGVDTNGRTVTIPAPSGSILTLARTDHPTLIAAARKVQAWQQQNQAAAPVGGRAAAPGAPTPSGAPASPSAPVQRTTPALTGGRAAAAARNFGAASSDGYLPIPGQTYASGTSGVTLVVHSDGSGTTDMSGTTQDVSAATVEAMLDPGTTLVPIGPRILTPTYSYQVGRWTNPNGDTLDVLPDGTGVVTPAGGTPAPTNEAGVNSLISAVGATSSRIFTLAGPSPARRGTPGLATTAATAANVAPAQNAPIPAPAGGWGSVGQIVPGAVFVNSRTGATLSIGPRGGGQVTAGGRTRNMGSAAAQTALNKRRTDWQLQTPGPTAPAYGAPAGAPSSPAAAAPTFTAPAAPAGGVTFTPAVGSPAAGFVSNLQGGQLFTGRGGRSMVIRPDGTADYISGSGPANRKSAAQARRMLGGASWTATSGPDIDVPGRAFAAAQRKAARSAGLPPVGQPVQGGMPSGTTSWPAASTGPVRAATASQLSRGQTVRVAGADWIVTETDASGQVWGYRPGVDDPLTIVRTADNKWHQGSAIPGVSGRRSVDVVDPVPVQATNVPSNGTPRRYDPSLGATAVDQAGAVHGTPFDVVTQTVKADTLQAGDVILINGRESEGTFVVTGVAPDHKGRPSVQGYAGTTADKAGVAGTPGHLFIAVLNGNTRETRVLVTDAPSPLPEVPRPVPPKGPSTIERNDISDASSQAKVADIMAGKVRGHPPGGARSGNAKMSNLLEMRGFNALPDVVSDAELDDYVDAGEVEIFRGMTGHHAGLDLGEEFRSGKNYGGGKSADMFGTGQYAGYGHSTSGGSFSGSPSAMKFAMDSYGYGQTGIVLRMTLKAEAKVGEYVHLKSAMDKEARTNKAVAAMAALGRRGVGYYAAYKGYDAIRGSNGYDGQYQTGIVSAGKKDEWEGGFLVILNRSAMRVSTKNFLPDNGKGPAGSDPPPIRYSAMRPRQRKGHPPKMDVDYTLKPEP